MGFQHRARSRAVHLEEFKGTAGEVRSLETSPGKDPVDRVRALCGPHKRKQWGKGKPETFTFLGFTHYCGRRHRADTFTVWPGLHQETANGCEAEDPSKVELHRRKHDRISQVGAWLRKVVTGYYQYHAVPGNIDQMRTFRQRVNRLWRNVLVRRSQRAKRRWESLTPVFNRWIPIPTNPLHPYPHARFHATHPS